MKTLMFFVLVAVLSLGAQLPPEEMNIYYIDASIPTADDGMNESAIFTLRTKLEASADVGNMLVFLSNGKEPKVIKKKKEIEKLLDDIYSKRFEIPNDASDKAMMRDMIYPELTKFNSNVNFHFFLSDMNARAVKDGSVSIVKFLPKEIGQILGNSAAIAVNVYYSNNSGKVNKSELEKSLEFFNSSAFSTVITYKVFDL